jgi:hypothetical protein
MLQIEYEQRQGIPAAQFPCLLLAALWLALQRQAQVAAAPTTPNETVG